MSLRPIKQFPKWEDLSTALPATTSPLRWGPILLLTLTLHTIQGQKHSSLFSPSWRWEHLRSKRQTNVFVPQHTKAINTKCKHWSCWLHNRNSVQWVACGFCLWWWSHHSWCNAAHFISLLSVSAPVFPHNDVPPSVYSLVCGLHSHGVHSTQVLAIMSVYLSEW